MLFDILKNQKNIVLYSRCNESKTANILKGKSISTKEYFFWAAEAVSGDPFWIEINFIEPTSILLNLFDFIINIQTSSNNGQLLNEKEYTARSIIDLNGPYKIEYSNDFINWAEFNFDITTDFHKSYNFPNENDQPKFTNKINAIRFIFNFGINLNYEFIKAELVNPRIVDNVSINVDIKNHMVPFFKSLTDTSNYENFPFIPDHRDMFLEMITYNEKTLNKNIFNSSIDLDFRAI